MDVVEKNMACKGPEGPYCWLLEERLAPEANQRIGGLVIIVITSFKSNTTNVLGVAHKLNARDVGLLLNHCPWCGGNIKPLDKYYKKSKRGKRAASEEE